MSSESDLMKKDFGNDLKMKLESCWKMKELESCLRTREIESDLTDPRNIDPLDSSWLEGWDKKTMQN